MPDRLSDAFPDFVTYFHILKSSNDVDQSELCDLKRVA